VFTSLAESFRYLKIMAKLRAVLDQGQGWKGRQGGKGDLITWEIP
jgi:hypothetical protein